MLNVNEENENLILYKEQFAQNEKISYARTS